MNRVVYLLGAGFSAPLGLPVMSNFIAKAKDLYFQSPERYQYFDEVFSQISQLSVIKNYFSSDLFNLEEVLSLIEMRSQLEGHPMDDGFFKFIADVIDHHTPDPKPYEKPRLPSNWWDFVFGIGELDAEYGCFAANLLNVNIRDEGAKDTGSDQSRFRVSQDPKPKTEYAIVTLNYDRVLERHCAFLNSRYQIEPNLKFREPSGDSGPWGQGTTLAKLHGSVGENRIVLPTWSKGINDRILNTWQCAYSALVKANHWRVIGFSLPESDSYLKFLLKAAVSEAQHLKSIDVICRDPSGAVSDRYRRFVEFPDYRFAPAEVQDLLTTLVKTQRGMKEDHGRTTKAMRYAALEKTHEDWMGTHSQ